RDSELISKNAADRHSMFVSDGIGWLRRCNWTTHGDQPRLRKLGMRCWGRPSIPEIPVYRRGRQATPFRQRCSASDNLLSGGKGVSYMSASAPRAETHR